MDGFFGIFKVVSFVCCLIVMLQLIPKSAAVEESSVPVPRSVDSLESRNLQLKLMEMAARRYASLAP